MSVTSMSSETRLFNLIPKPGEFKNSPYVMSQRPSSASSIKHSTTQSKNISFKPGSENKSRGNRSEIQSNFQLPKGVINEMPYQSKVQNKIKEHQQNLTQRPLTAVKLAEKRQQQHFNPKEKGCCKVPEDFSEYNEYCQHKRPPVPKHNQGATQLLTKKNFVKQNAVDGQLGNNLTKTQQLQIVQQREKQRKEEMKNEIMQNKKGKVPEYLEKRNKEIMRDTYKQHQNFMKSQADNDKEMYLQLKLLQKKKEKLKQHYDEVHAQYQRKFGHKTNITLQREVEEKLQMEKQFKSLEQEMKHLDKQQNVCLNIYKGVEQKNEINEHDLEHNQKLKLKNMSKNLSQFHHFAPVSR